jgi:hypothetical protein
MMSVEMLLAISLDQMMLADSLVSILLDFPLMVSISAQLMVLHSAIELENQLVYASLGF